MDTNGELMVNNGGFWDFNGEVLGAPTKTDAECRDPLEVTGWIPWRASHEAMDVG